MRQHPTSSSCPTPCCLARLTAYKSPANRPLHHHIHAAQNKDRVTEDALDFVRRLVVFDAAERMSVQEALEHPFIAGGARWPGFT